MVISAAIKLGTRGAKSAAGDSATGEGIGGLLEKILRTLKPLADLLGLIVSILLFKILKAIDAIAPLGTILQNIIDFFGGLFDFGVWMGEHLADFVIGLFDFGIWLGEHFADFIIGVFDIAKWLGKQLIDFVVGLFDFGVWLGDKIADFVIGLFDFGVWLGDQIADFVIGTFDFGQWLFDNITNFLKGQFGGFFGGGEGGVTTAADVLAVTDAATGVSTNTFNFFGLTIPEALEQIKRELGIGSFNQGRI